MYKVNKVTERLIVFGEEMFPGSGMVNAMQLVIGDKKAALIDTGQGIERGLDKAVREYTDLPLIVLLTHADPDHIGSCPLFKDCDIYLSDRDDALIEWALRGRRFPYKNIKDGDTFDLGGVTLEAFATPGHSQGSMCFIDKTGGYAMTGDSINPMPWLWLERCTPIAKYVDSIKRFQSMAEENGIERFYCGHGMDALLSGVVGDLIAAGEEIIAGKTATDAPPTFPMPPEAAGKTVLCHGYGGVAIVYDKEKH